MTYIYHIIYLLYIYYAYYMEHPQFHMGCKPLTKWDAHPRTVESQWNIGVPMDCNDSHQPKDWMKLASQRLLSVRFLQRFQHLSMEEKVVESCRINQLKC